MDVWPRYQVLITSRQKGYNRIQRKDTAESEWLTIAHTMGHLKNMESYGIVNALRRNAHRQIQNGC